ncbi:MAG: DUF4403 family protein, partial [Bacteroidota bacterium]
MRRPLLLGLLGFLLLAGVSGGVWWWTSGPGEITAQPPHREPPRVMPMQVISTLYVPIQIPSREIQDVVNDAIPRKLYAEQDIVIRKGIFKAALDLEVLRNGAAQVQVKDNKLITHIPLRANGLVRTGIGVKRSFTTTFVIHSSSDAWLDEAWGLRTQTQGSFTWQQEPVIKVLGIKIKVRDAAGRQMQKQINDLAPKIDQMLYEKINIRGLAERLWNDLCRPLAVSEKPPAWLNVRPISLHFMPMKTKPDTVEFGLAALANMRMVMGANEAEADSADPLPDLQRAAVGLETFHVDLAAMVPYDEAGQLVTDAIRDTVFVVGDDQIRIGIERVELYPSGPNLVAGITFDANIPRGRADIGGTVYFQGQPVYSDDTKTIRVDSLRYDVESESRLAEVASWMLHDSFVERVQSQLVIPLEDQIEFARTQLEEAVDRRKLGDHVVLSGRIEDLSPGRLYLNDDGLNV